MKLRVKKLFKYTWDNITTHKLLPGEYDVPGEVAENTALLAIQFGVAVWINVPRPAPITDSMLQKEAPENKVVYPPANKKKKVTRKKKGRRKR
jgi:hypothetical protein